MRTAVRIPRGDPRAGRATIRKSGNATIDHPVLFSLYLRPRSGLAAIRAAGTIRVLRAIRRLIN